MPNDGHRSAVQDLLSKVLQIQAFVGLLAAVLGDRCVATWGSTDVSSAVQDRLESQSSLTAFLLQILGNQFVAPWGNPYRCREGSAEPVRLRHERQDHARCGGDSSAVQDRAMCGKFKPCMPPRFAAVLGDDLC